MGNRRVYAASIRYVPNQLASAKISPRGRRGSPAALGYAEEKGERVIAHTRTTMDLCLGMWCSPEEMF